MKFPTSAAPYLKPQNSVNRVMQQVLMALVPGMLALSWSFGVGVFVNIVLATGTALAAEAAVLLLRRRPIMATLQDLSAVVTAVLLALALPVIAPWWIAVIGAFFAVVVAKHFYGGLGYNPFNPAMAGYVLLLVSFPKQMTAWLTPDAIATASLSFAETFRLIFLEQLPAGLDHDAITMATPLDTAKTQLGLHKPLTEIHQSPVFGLLAGKGWDWVALAYLAGGLWLVRHKVIGWQIPAGLLGGLAVFAGMTYMIDSSRFASPLFHVFAGATMLGAFFIATDPVTAATSSTGRIIYGLFIGALIYIIRVWGGFPDAVAFAVLLANLAVPTIDYYTRPRIFGQRS